MTTPVLSLLDPAAAADYHARGLWQKDTIYAIAARNAARGPERPAYRDRFRTITWREAVDAADRLAGDLLARGVKPGQRVAFWLPDRIESAIIMLAASRAGLTSCPSPHRNHTIAEVTDLISRLRAAAFFYQPAFGSDARAAGRHDEIREKAEALPTMRHVYRLPALEAGDAARSIIGEAIDRPAVAALPAPASNPDRVSYIAFTSGSTGNPKGVMHSDNTLLVTARSLNKDWKLGPDDVISTLSPFSHNLGVGALMTALVAGAELVMHDTPRGESIVDRLAAVGATYIVGVPTHALDLVGEAKRRGMTRLGRVRGFRISGAASPPQVMRDLLDLGVEPQSGYGMTENNSHQYTRPGDGIERLTGSCGRACEGYEIGVFDTEDRDRRLEPGERGLIGGRGACLMLGYFGDQLATESAFNADGWFMTGDVGEVDAAGYLKLTGRQKELLIRGGHNISPGRIEELASGFEGIARAAVLALPDPRLGERICLAYVKAPGAQVEPVPLNDFLAGRGLSRYELPEFLLEVGEMPLMANGKIDKGVLMKAIGQGRLAPLPVDVAGAGATA